MGMLMMRETMRMGVWLHGKHPEARQLRKEVRVAERKIGSGPRMEAAQAKRERRMARNRGGSGTVLRAA